MTAKEKLTKQLRPLCKVSGGTGNSIPATEEAVKYCVEFASHIAEQAVGDEIKTFDALGKAYAKDILSRIKTLTEQQ